ncbi:MAG: dihydroxyacetone kinase subunit DhaL [Thermoguttaceae bacterium]
MPQELTYADLAGVLESGARRIRENYELLSRLDSATGDGDHGVTMKRTAEAILQSVQACSGGSIAALLEQLGWNVMSIDGGATGPLLGSFFMGMAEAAAGCRTLGGPALAGVFEAGLAKLRAQTPAKPGDKTLLDALVPAVEALRQAADQGSAPAEMLARAAAAAQQGAQGTRELQARFGRARNLGPRTIGHVDPGATSISLLLAGFRDGLSPPTA